MSLDEGWPQLLDLLLAFALSAIIGLERQANQKSAGLRTHSLVGIGSALFMLVSKYGFTDLVGPGFSIDPSRVAAQVVSGIGFIGGGVIFVRRDIVRGLTTAAVIWLTASVGLAAGAGLPVLAVAVTALHFVVVFALPVLARRFPHADVEPSIVRVDYFDGRGTLRQLLPEFSRHGFAVVEVRSAKAPFTVEADGGRDVLVDERVVSLKLELSGRGSLNELTTELSLVDGVVAVRTEPGMGGAGDRD